MLLENLVTRRVSEENVSNSSLTRRVTKQGYLLLAALALNLRLASLNFQRDSIAQVVFLLIDSVSRIAEQKATRLLLAGRR